VQENGRFAMEMLGRNIREAGYTNILFCPPASPASLYAPPSATSFVKADGTPDVAITSCDNSAGGPPGITVSYDTASNNCPNAAAPGGRAVYKFWINTQNNQLMMCQGNDCGNDCGNDSGSQGMLDDVEDMQILYGEDTDNDQTPNRYVPAGTAGLVMGNVYAVHVCVLVRSDEDNLADKKQTYIDCKGASVTATDRRIRRTFSATYNLRNRTQ
jgi:type IV pilus assembly protein PilW